MLESAWVTSECVTAERARFWQRWEVVVPAHCGSAGGSCRDATVDARDVVSGRNYPSELKAKLSGYRGAARPKTSGRIENLDK